MSSSCFWPSCLPPPDSAALTIRWTNIQSAKSQTAPLVRVERSVNYGWDGNLWIMGKLWSASCPGKKQKSRRRDLHRLVPQRSVDRDLARPTAAEPEQQEANPNTAWQNWETKPGQGQTVHLTTEQWGRLTACDLSAVNLPFAPASFVNRRLENSIAGIPA